MPPTSPTTTTPSAALPDLSVRKPLTPTDILNAAVQAFVADGYRRTSMQHVAKILGVTRQAIYHYYPRKVDILLALFLRWYDEADEAISRDLELTSSNSASARFDSALTVYGAVVLRSPHQAALLDHERPNLPPDLLEKVLARRHETQMPLVELYTQAVTDGDFREDPDASMAVQWLLGAYNWSFRWTQSFESLDPYEFSTSARRLFSLGYRCSAEVID